ncbi:hypothetical protein VPHD358_0169 [Vibrio phage D358]
MSNISKSYKLALCLGESEGQSANAFYENFSAKERYINGEFTIKYGDLDWRFCTHSDHLICKQEFETREEAEAAEYVAFDILSEFGYYLPEED